MPFIIELPSFGYQFEGDGGIREPARRDDLLANRAGEIMAAAAVVQISRRSW